MLARERLVRGLRQVIEDRSLRVGEGIIAAVCRAFLLTAMLSAGLSKLVQRDRFFRALAGLPWLSLRVARPASVVIPAVEIAVGSALIFAPRAAATAAFLMVAVFTVVIATERASGRRFRCGCFGGAGVRAAGADALIRNVLLLASAAVVLLQSASWSPPATLTGMGLGLLLLLYEVGTDTMAVARQR